MASSTPAALSPIEIEKFRISELLSGHFNALDDHDWDLLRLSFSDDATATYGAGTADENTMQGGKTIVDRLIVNMGKVEKACHSIGNQFISVDADRARARIFAVIHLLAQDRILLRGVRYEDHLTKHNGEWRISQRKHEPLWQCEAPAVPSKFPQK